MSEDCCCSNHNTMILACSGGSNVGQLANQAAIDLTREGIGKMFCLAGIGGQLSGFIQSASMTLKEQVTYTAEGITSVDWETYPILTFSEAPRIETVILNRPGAPFMGAGEASIGPTAAAIANAVYDAVGVRCRDIPLLPERVKKLLDRG